MKFTLEDYNTATNHGNRGVQELLAKVQIETCNTLQDILKVLKGDKDVKETKASTNKLVSTPSAKTVVKLLRGSRKKSKGDS